MTNTETAKLKIRDQELDLPIYVGTENESAIDIGSLRKQTGAITLDEGFVNTGSTSSAITYLNGEKASCGTEAIPLKISHRGATSSK